MAQPIAARIVNLHERERRIFGREALIDQNGQSLILPETRSLSAVELREIFTGIELRVLGLIGYLPLTSHLVLNLRPKFPIENLWRMLAYADETYERVLPVLRSYERVEASAPHQLLARGFCHYLKEILSIGITRGYFPQTYEGYFKPKILFGRTVGRYLSRGDDVHAVSAVFGYSPELQINALLKSACIDFLQVMPRNVRWDNERRLIQEAMNALHQVTPMRMRVGEESSVNLAPIWLRDHYHGALCVYSLLLGYSKIGFSYATQGVEMPSFLFRLDNIFESFVRNSLREGFEAVKLSVADGNEPRHQLSLFRDNRQFPIKPDVIIKRGRDVIAIGEVKYKRRIEETDRYQVISHVVASAAPIGFWISPAQEGQKGSLKYIGSIENGAKFYHYQLNLFDELEAARTEMTAELRRLIELTE